MEVLILWVILVTALTVVLVRSHISRTLSALVPVAVVRNEPLPRRAVVRW